MSFPAGELEIANIPRRIATAVSYVKSVLLFTSRDPQPRKIYRIENKQGVLPGKDPLSRASFALNYFVNSICSPSIRAASARFQQGPIFSGTPPRLLLEHPSFFLAYASQHLPMLRLRDRFNPFDAELSA